MMSVMDFQMRHGCSISGLYGLMDKVKQRKTETGSKLKSSQDPTMLKPLCNLSSIHVGGSSFCLCCICPSQQVSEALASFPVPAVCIQACIEEHLQASASSSPLSEQVPPLYLSLNRELHKIEINTQFRRFVWTHVPGANEAKPYMQSYK